MKKNNHDIIALVLLPLLVIGCTQGQESFSTEPGKGYGWKDMTETQKEIHKEITPEGLNPMLMQGLLPIPVTSVTYPISSPNGSLSSVTRMPEQYVKIWFAPYQDSAGNLHEECAVHTVMQTGQWVVPKVDDRLTA
jgi:hypothetical protein